MEDLKKYNKDLSKWEKEKDALTQGAVQQQAVQPSTSSSQPVGSTTIPSGRRASKKAAAAPPTPPTAPHRRMLPNEPYNILRLATLLKLMFGRVFSLDAVERIVLLYRAYLFDFRSVSFACQLDS